MGNNNEEDVFNALMNSPTGKEDTPKQADVASSGNKIFTDIPITGRESSEDLVNKFRDIVEKAMEQTEYLFSYLQNGLGPLFEKIKGAWMQYKEGVIGLDMFAYSGIIVLGKSFIDLFVEYRSKVEIPVAPKSESVPAQISVVAESKGIFSENPFAKSSTTAPEPISKADGDSIVSGLPEPELKPEPVPKADPQPLTKSQPQVKIPSLFLTSDMIEPSIPKPVPQPKSISKSSPNPEIQPHHFTKPAIKAPKKKLLSEISAFGSPSSSKPKTKTEVPETPKVIASVAPETKTRSKLEAIGAIDSQLAEVKLEPMKFDHIDDSELKMVNVGATTPGSPLFDEFGDIEDLLHRKQYGIAEKKLKELKIIAEKRGLDYQMDRAEDMLMNLNVYQMLPSLLQGGDNVIDEDLDRAEEKYNKALKFAKILGDSWYISKIDARLSQVNQRKAFLRKKQTILQEEDDKINKLIKDNIIRLGKTELLSSVPDIRKYCNAKSNELVEKILIEMIKNKEIYAKYFPGSKKVMFDKESNRMLAFKI
ncbi:MAG: hypothetical protein ACTSR8_21420 [Promethearchaeota archaeon]